jgi:hypothetical protein
MTVESSGVAVAIDGGDRQPHAFVELAGEEAELHDASDGELESFGQRWYVEGVGVHGGLQFAVFEFKFGHQSSEWPCG